MSMLDHALAYIDMGLALCSIAPGTKGPNTPGWNQPGAVLNTREAAMAEFTARPQNGLGLIHSASGTCAIDVDSLEHFRLVLGEFGLDLDTLFAGAPRIIGRPGRDKAVFRVPPDIALSRRSLAWPAPPGETKPITVFELRGGPVQDVLPPTIHPDTRQPYRWREGAEPFGRDIPMIPGPLLAMWRAWDDFKPQMMAMCPWAKKADLPAPPKPLQRAMSSENSNVIGQFNRAHDISAILEANGYVRRGKRFLSPTSSTKLAGVVVFEDGTHCYSHHASDPLNDGHAHDAFDLYVQFDHAGDVGAAVRGAADILGIERAPTATVDVAALTAAAKARKAKPEPVPLDDVNGVPSELLRVPGVLGEFVDHIVASAIKPQRVLAVNGALSLGALMMARSYAGVTGLRTNLYVLGVAPSTAGKEQARRAVKSALKAFGKTQLLGGEDIKSGGAILTRAKLSPACLFQLDEFGLLMQAVSSPRATGYQAEILTNLMKLYTSADTVFIGPEYANQQSNQRMDIEYPCVSVHGTTTGDTLWESLSSKHVLSGFLNRFVLTQSEAPEAVRQKPTVRVSAIPDSLTAWAHDILDVQSKQVGNLHGFSPDAPIVVGQTREGERILDAFALQCDAEASKLRGTGLDALWGRSHEIALKISVIVAGSIDPKHPNVDAEAARWAVLFVATWTRRTVADVRKLVVDPEFAANYRSVVNVMEQLGASGASKRDFKQRWRGWERLRKFEQDALLDTITANGDGFFVKRRGQRGPATPAWVARKHAPEAMISDVEENPC